MNFSVVRDGNCTLVSSEEIVPGDVVVLRPGPVCADMAILEADVILVDESALTGEPTPVGKSEIEISMEGLRYDPKRHSSFTVSAGTEILEAGEPGTGRGLVLSTASYTDKGDLLADVFAYGRHKAMFDDEIVIILSVLTVEAVIFVSLIFSWLGEQWVYAWFYGEF
jgi:magnesium-transporting ATPase (P-type)